jgi:glycine oxidase
MLAPVTEIHPGEETLLQLNLKSAQMFGEFAGRVEECSGLHVGYRKTGTVVVARDADDNSALNELFSLQARLGLKAERLRAREVREHEPGLSPSVRGGIFVEGDHQVDNRALVAALLVACERTGVMFVRAEATEITLEADSISGVRLANGELLGASQVVVAAGARSGELAGVPSDVAPPVRPVKGQSIHLKGPARDPICLHNVRGLDVYLVPRADGRVVIGATVEERGWDGRVTAEAVYTLLRDAYELLPGIVELEFVEAAVGFRPGTPDNAPILGRSDIEGLIYATGHYRNGILLVPITAEAIAGLLVTGGVVDEIESFSPKRFSKKVET